MAVAETGRLRIILVGYSYSSKGKVSENLKTSWFDLHRSNIFSVPEYTETLFYIRSLKHVRRAPPSWFPKRLDIYSLVFWAV